MVSKVSKFVSSFSNQRSLRVEIAFPLMLVFGKLAIIVFDGIFFRSSRVALYCRVSRLSNTLKMKQMSVCGSLSMVSRSCCSALPFIPYFFMM